MDQLQIVSARKCQCTTSLSNQRGFTFSHLHDKSSCLFGQTTPPIRIECPLFVLSLASRSFIHGEALKWICIPYLSVFHWRRAKKQTNKKRGTNPHLSKQCLILIRRVRLSEMWPFNVRPVKIQVCFQDFKNFLLSFQYCCQRYRPRRWKESGRILTTADDGENAWKRQKEKAALWWQYQGTQTKPNDLYMFWCTLLLIYGFFGIFLFKI